MKMRNFIHIDTSTVDEAVSALESPNAWAIAGGTDLLGTMKFHVLPDSMYPEFIVNLKTITPSLDYIKEEDGMLKIGALTRLEDIAKNETVISKYMALAEAAHRTASPHIREQGTIGGNICQLNRCWYFRKANNRFFCLRKGGSICFAILGENRYHSIFGGIQACIAVNHSDIAPALVALDARIVTSKRELNAEDFWDVKGSKSTVLDGDEIVTEIQVPTPTSDAKNCFIKFALRSSIDFPIVNCAAAIGDGNARICLNAVFNKPYRTTKAEETIKGKTIDESSAEVAGTAAVADSVALALNGYKIKVAKVLVKRAILLCEPGGSFAQFAKDWS
jgi:xanthine dehydrogenase YagS FAD-binding subunit